jgi:hypothetical protein
LYYPPPPPTQALSRNNSSGYGAAVAISKKHVQQPLQPVTSHHQQQHQLRLPPTYPTSCRPNPLGWMWPSLPQPPPANYSMDRPSSRHPLPVFASEASRCMMQQQHGNLARHETHVKIAPAAKLSNGTYGAVSDNVTSVNVETKDNDLEFGIAVDDDAEDKQHGGRKKRSTWVNDEDERLRETVKALEVNGTKANWTDVAKVMPGRDSKQCRDRWVSNKGIQRDNNLLLR